MTWPNWKQWNSGKPCPLASEGMRPALWCLMNTIIQTQTLRKCLDCMSPGCLGSKTHGATNVKDWHLFSFTLPMIACSTFDCCDSSCAWPWCHTQRIFNAQDCQCNDIAIACILQALFTVLDILCVFGWCWVLLKTIQVWNYRNTLIYCLLYIFRCQETLLLVLASVTIFCVENYWMDLNGNRNTHTKQKKYV